MDPRFGAFRAVTSSSTSGRIVIPLVAQMRTTSRPSNVAGATYARPVATTRRTNPRKSPGAGGGTARTNAFKIRSSRSGSPSLRADLAERPRQLISSAEWASADASMTQYELATRVSVGLNYRLVA